MNNHIFLTVLFVLASNVRLLSQVEDVTLISTYDSSLNNLSFNIEVTGTITDCYYTLYSAKKVLI